MSGAASKLLEVPEKIVQKRLTENELKDLQEELVTDDHVIPLEKLCQKLNTDERNGLTEEEAEKVCQIVGLNALTPPKVTPEYIKFLKCMFHGFAGLLWACSLLCYILYGISMIIEGTGGGIQWLGMIITAICLISGFAAYIQEGKNTKVSKLQTSPSG